MFRTRTLLGFGAISLLSSAGLFGLIVPLQTLASAATFAESIPQFASPPSTEGDIDDTWSRAVRMRLAFDFTYQRPASDEAQVFVGSDASSIDIAFRVERTSRETTTQTTNGAGVLSDDHVTVALFPQGTQGVAYTFSANARGARYQTSSENSSYAPEWTAGAHRSANGYVVTMRIPREILRSGGETKWKAQFEAFTIATNSDEVWAHEPEQRSAEDPTYAGILSGLGIADTKARPKARLQVYALGEATDPNYGGSTSRIGADLALPITATSSLLATVHPDYSNVETDQQTISPSAYPRQYSEVRPFFTQAAANFNYRYGCTNCPLLLYTPAIPAFRDGFAYTGTSGPLTFGAFDAVGTHRTDQGQTVNYAVSNLSNAYSVSAQRVVVANDFTHDDSTSLLTGFGNQRTHLFAYANIAEDRGGFVSNPGLANYLEYGAGYASRQTYAVLSFQNVGAQFSPADGYVAQPDVAGAFGAYSHTFNFAKKDALLDVFVNADLGKFHDHFGHVAQTDSGAQINLDFQNLLSVRIYQSLSGIEVPTSEL